jgi:N-acetylneuraminic acid mutarotase
MNEPRQEVGVAIVAGKLYVAGGFRVDATTADTVEVFDPEKNEWKLAAPMPMALHHPAAASIEGKLYIFGGTSLFGVSGVTLQYDPDKDQWAMKTPMPSARSAAAAAVLGNRIYVVGGSPDARGRDVASYDPAMDAWMAHPPMPTPRNHHAAAAIGGKLYVVGGRPPFSPGLGTLEVFNPTTNEWATLLPMPTGRSGIAAAVVRGCLYVFGGEGNPLHPLGVYPQNEVYNPKLNRWESLPPMPTPRHGIGAGVIGEKVYVPGGATAQGLRVAVPAVLEVFAVPEGKSCESET